MTSMAKLPGWSFMVVGVLMILYVGFIERRTEANLIIFFWLGIVFIAWGFLREINQRVLKTRKKPPKPKVGPPKREVKHDTHKHPAGHQVHGQSPHETHIHTRPLGHQHESHPYEKPHKTCPRCHAYNTLHAKHCTKCAHQFY